MEPPDDQPPRLDIPETDMELLGYRAGTEMNHEESSFGTSPIEPVTPIIDDEELEKARTEKEALGPYPRGGTKEELKNWRRRNLEIARRTAKAMGTQTGWGGVPRGLSATLANGAKSGLNLHPGDKGEGPIAALEVTYTRALVREIGIATEGNLIPPSALAMIGTSARQLTASRQLFLKANLEPVGSDEHLAILNRASALATQSATSSREAHRIAREAMPPKKETVQTTGRLKTKDIFKHHFAGKKQ